MDDFDPIFEFIPRPRNLKQFENLLKKPKSIKLNRGLKKLLSDEINYPYQTSSIEKISTFIEKNNKANKNFKLFNFILIFIFLLIQNYHAFKFFIKKKLFKFKEKSSIFSIGLIRYLKICYYFKR